MTPHVYPVGSFFKSLDDIEGKKVTVMGLGLNGGGLATVEFFLRHGAFVTVTDMKDDRQLKSTIDALKSDALADRRIGQAVEASRLTYHLGGHIIEDFAECDCVIKNPGVKYEGNKYLSVSPVIESDLSVFLSLNRAPIIAVTGSKGKSSTVSAIHWILTHCGIKSFLGGNITVSPLTFIEECTKTTPVVLELSSWQLADLRGRKLLKPKISIITKIVPDHQNWYEDMASYVADKRLIYTEQDETDCSIFDTDEWGDSFTRESRARVFRYSTSPLEAGVFGAWQENIPSRIMSSSITSTVGKVRVPNSNSASRAQGKGAVEKVVMKDLMLPGRHVRSNALNAALAAVLMGAAAQDVCNALSTWPGVEHRLQLCHQWVHSFSGHTQKVHFYDDSCSTVSEATAAAIAAFNTPIVLIAGGTDKGLGQRPLAECLTNADNILSLYLLSGTATDKLLPLLKEKGVGYRGIYDSLDALLKAIRDDIKDELLSLPLSGGALPVVFSPGATSFGMFANEFDRGDKFQQSVRKLF